MIKITNIELNPIAREVKLRNNFTRNIFKSVHVSFKISGISRLESYVLQCLNGSYTEQSLRYCVAPELVTCRRLDTRGYYNTDKIIAKQNTLYEIYKALMTTDPKVKGRPSVDHYPTYGILPEEARQLLPVAIETNMVCTLTGSQLCEMVQEAITNITIYDVIKAIIVELFNDNIWKHMVTVYGNLVKGDVKEDTETYYKIEDQDQFPPKVHPAAKTAFAGRISSTYMKDETFSEDLSKDIKMMGRLEDMKHVSTFEHVMFTIPSVLSFTSIQQLNRGRFVNITQINDLQPLDLVMLPTSMHKCKALFEGKTISEHFREYHILLKDMATELSESEYVSTIVSEYILMGSKLSTYVNTNLISLCTVLTKRICRNSQEEIRLWAIQQYRHLVLLYPDIEPILRKIALPGCMNGKCPEKSYTCGKPYKKEDFDVNINLIGVTLD